MSLISPAEAQTAGRAGGVATLDYDAQSGYATTALNAGTLVRAQSTEGLYAPPASSADVARLAGAIVYNPTVAVAATGEDYAAGAILPILREGIIWLVTEQALTVGSNPFVRYATGAGGSVKGVLRTDADTSTAAQCPGIEVLAVVGTTLAKCKINLPQ